MRTAEDLALMLVESPNSIEIQVRQIRFRKALVADWGIPEGARILEIGCGQGDTTVVLADAVGAGGSIVAVDLADPSYGAPITLGESSRRTLSGPLGSRVEFRFNYDILSASFSADEFDLIVMAHCTWYFKDLQSLRQTLEHVRPWAPNLCLSEWDLEPRELNQLGHLLAVILQGQVELHKSESSANIRSPYSLSALRELLATSGWSIDSESTLDSSEMDDGRWEFDHCLRNSMKEAEAINLTPKALEWTRSLYETLHQLAARGDNAALPAYTIVACRA